MKQRFLHTVLALTCCLFALTATAANNERLTHSKGRTYTLTVLGDYGYNTTWGHYGGGELRAFLPFNDNVEMFINTGAFSSNTYAGSLTIRPKVAVPVGEFFADATFAYTSSVRANTHDFVGALSLGYRMDYLNFQVGCFSRTLAPFQRTWNSNEEYVNEPFNLLYRLSINVRPLCERWNLYFGMANFNELEYERMWQPLFFLGAYYDFPPSNNFEYKYSAASHFRILAEVMVKPAGMFHLDASFYGCKAKFGFAYKF